MAPPAGSPLANAIQPCGPVVDKAAAARAREVIEAAAQAEGWEPLFELSWPALAPVLSASPYLAGLARRDPARLGRILAADPDARLGSLLAEALAVAGEPDPEVAGRALRRLKAELHLMTALADLGGMWGLDQVTGALTRFADAAVQAALSVAAAA